MTGSLQTTRPTDVGQHLAAHAAGLLYEQLPGPAVSAAKKTVLDSVAVMLAASGTEPAVRSVVELVRESGGREESSVLGFGFKAPAVMAALANGAMAHALNYDDYLPSGQHCSLSVVPAVLAIAERARAVSGRELIAAVAAGQDIFARLRCNVDWRKDWNLSTVMGAYAATAAAGRALRLSAEQISSAFAIASGDSGGLLDAVSALGSHIGAIYGAFPAKGAVTAALLAQKDTAGVDSVFESQKGVFNTYFAGRYDRDAMLAGLGVEYLGAGTLYKPWPANGTAHSHIHATIELVSRQKLAAQDIKEFHVFVGDVHEILCTPPAERRAPKTLLDARFSLPFLVALAAVRRSLAALDFTTEALGDRHVLALAQRVVPVRDPALDWKVELPNGRIEVVMRDGHRFEQVARNVPGSADAPMTWDDISDKFAQCATAAAIPVTPENIKRAQTMAAELERLDDIADLLAVLSGP